MRLVIAVIGFALIVAAIVVGVGGDDEAAAGEIFLEAAADPGQSPFTEPVDPEPTTTTTAATTTSAGAPPPVVVATQPTSGVTPPPGSPPYGGSGDDTVCDREALITFLTSTPDRGTAWAGVLGIDPAEIEPFIRSLTPTVLLYDTRVTNHGFRDGRAYALQSVLQAGTAVLVDADGNPVTRCRCGNPLLPPAPVPAPALVGTPWPAFQPAAVVAVDDGATVTVSIAPAATTTTTGASTTTSTAGGGSPSSSTASSVPITEVEGLVAALSECAGADGTVEVVSIEQDADLAGLDLVTVRVNGVEMLFQYEPATGAIGEGDRASAELLADCGVG